MIVSISGPGSVGSYTIYTYCVSYEGTFSMAMTLQEISDRFEITDLLTDYCSAIDTKNIDAFDRIFTQDACIDYSKAGGPKADLKTIKTFLHKNLGDLPRQHSVSNIQIRINGDVAQVRCLCLNPLELPPQGDVREVALWGIWYDDKFIRTSDGWRIQQRVTQPCFNWKMQRINS